MSIIRPVSTVDYVNFQSKFSRRILREKIADMPERLTMFKSEKPAKSLFAVLFEKLKLFTSKNNSHKISKPEIEGLQNRCVTYKEGSNTIDTVFEFEPETKKTIKSMHYSKNGEYIETVKEYDRTTGKESRITYCRPDGTPVYIKEFNPQTSNLERTILYGENRLVFNIEEFDPESARKVKSSWYLKNKLNNVTEYSSITGKKSKDTYYGKDGRTVIMVEEFNPENEKRIKAVYYTLDGKCVNKVDEFDSQTGTLTKTLLYNRFGELYCIDEYDKLTGKQTRWVRD